MGNKVSLEDELINLKIVSKQMQRSAKKCEKSEKAAIEKLKKVRGDGYTLTNSACVFVYSSVTMSILFCYHGHTVSHTPP